RFIAATGPARKSLDLFDAADGHLLRHIADLQARAGLLETSADAATICVGLKKVSGSPPADDVWLWDPSSPEGRRLPTENRTSSIALTPAGRWAAFGYSSPTLWDTANSAIALHPSQPRAALQVAVSDDGLLLAAGGDDKTILLWHRGSETPLTLRAHSGEIT